MVGRTGPMGVGGSAQGVWEPGDITGAVEG